jgi:hypothetical protein
MVIAIYKILPLLPVLYVATNSQSAYACKQGGELEEDNEEGLRVAEEDEEGSIELEGNKEGWIHSPYPPRPPHTTLIIHHTHRTLYSLTSHPPHTILIKITPTTHYTH